MNERTQDLIKQFATNLLNRSGYDMREYEPFLEETEKLVEAIVKECADVADTADATREKWEGIGKYVREYFGVD